MKLSDYTTAQAGILQSAAYRNLQHFITEQLQDKHISMPEWGLLGLVYQAGASGISTSKLAEDMYYDLPHVTNIANALEQRGYLKREVNSNDRRQKRLVLTKTGAAFVDKTEKELRQAMSLWLKGINRVQLISYINVLKELAVRKPNN